MKTLRNIAILLSLLASSSCAFLFNEKEVDVSISSNPTGADIFIDGVFKGKTPATLHIEPKTYNVNLVKNGYGSASVKLEWWQAIREKQGDGGRCLADALGTMLVLPAFSFASVYCRDFKKKEYFVEIPRQGNNYGSQNNNSMMGIGNNPNNAIEYYYNQNNNQYQGYR